MPADMPAASGRAGEPAFVGRESELSSMRAAARETLGGRAATILVDGPPGIGKSALLREFPRRSPEFRTIAATAYADESALPYGLITQLALAMKAWGHDPGLSVATRDGDPVAVGMTLLESLAAAAADAPVLVLVDDLQFADPESAMVLRFLVRRLWADRVCVAVTSDGAGGVPGGRPGGPASVRVSLAGLNRDDIAALVDRQWGRADNELIARLAGWTAGNPALVWAALSDERWIDDPSGEPPAAIDAALGSVIDRLPAGCRAVLQALSILHNPARTTTVAEVADVSGRLPELLEPLLAARLVRVPAGSSESLEFVTAALRTATERNLDPGTRHRLHANAATRARGREEQLAHLVAATAGPDPELAARLSAEVNVETATGDLLRAARYALWAADVATTGQGRTESLVTAVRLFVRVGRGGSALRLADRVDALPPSWLRDEAQGLLAYVRGEPATALPLLRRAESTSTDVPARARARLAVEVATVAVALFAGDVAVQASERARRLTDEPEVDRLAAATGAFGRAIVDGPDAALAELEDLPAEPAECAEQDLTGLTFRGLFRGVVGRLDEAIADLTVAARRREATRVAVFGVTAHIHLAWCQLDVGLGDVALQTLQVGSELADVYGRAFDHAALRSSTAITLAVRGDVAGARRELAESVRLSAHSDFLGPAFHQVLARAAIAWSVGSFGDVVTHLEPWTTQRVDRHRTDLFGLWWLPLLADAQLATGRGEDAARTVERLAAIDGAPGSMRDTAVAWFRGRLARRAGDVTTALRILRTAAGPDFGARPNLYSGMVLRALGDAQYEAGDHPAARRSFEAAIGTLDTMGVVPLAARCRERMARLFTEPEPPRRSAVLDRLTEKEGQVAVLIARGWTNPEIAKTLFVSTKTVEYHLRNIYIKLDLPGRRQLRDLLQAPAA